MIRNGNLEILFLGEQAKRMWWSYGH